MIKPYYQDDYCTIYHGDCLDILPQLPTVDLVLTDPPYGLGKKLYTGGTWATNPIYDSMLEWDVKRVDNKLILKIITHGKKSIVWGGHLYSLPISRCWIVWEKQNKLQSMGACELAWTNIDKPIKMITELSNPDGKRAHPTQKPLSVMKFCIVSVDENQLILDPFMGSGTTLRAAKDLQRKAIGIEIEEKYCEIAAKRLSQEVLPL